MRNGRSEGRLRASGSMLLAVALLLVLALLAGCADAGEEGAADEGAADEGAADDEDADDESAGAAGSTCDDLDLAEAEEFYENATMRYIIPYGPGGGNDTYAREFTPFLEEELGADIVPENIEGGGGLVGTNQWTSEEDPDGTTLAIFSATGQIMNMMAGLDEIEFTQEDLHWLGAFASAPQTVTVVRNGPYQSWDAVLESEETVRYGSVGPGGTPFYTWGVLHEAFPEIDTEPIRGFAGSSEQNRAMLAGDIAMRAGSMDIFEEGDDFMNILTIASDRVESQPDVPTIFEYDISAEAEEIARALAGISQLHRPILTHADVPQERKCVLENAVREALQRPEFEERLNELGRQFDPSSPDEAAQLADESINNVPESFENFVTELANEAE